MRQLISGLAAAVLLAGTSAVTVVATAKPASAAPASVSAASALPTCRGTRIMHHPVYTTRGLKAAYIHVFYDKRTRIACAFINSTNATWGTRKHMVITLRYCSAPSSWYAHCPGQRQWGSRSGWYSGRSQTVHFRLASSGYLKAEGGVSWGQHSGVSVTPSKFFGVGGAARWVFG
ncbi:hypothetical protein TBS_34610 [Thermobispora bispora]|jgi:hypothetical protein|uniref:hypothetical protein n=1 Tax=Thermobispora bispora TaxID=2006 RepID=UPI00197CBE7D|nr:hypothetical protein [Thermobispora bispora]MBO2473503.1 hypothetical protein [Actinomycetales bacterium]MDI9581692.1 hypothetical protein [Thermobispora sp.]QSI49070.1 hypothetical protein CYL17_15405 [Thermobispora bispora]